MLTLGSAPDLIWPCRQGHILRIFHCYLLPDTCFFCSIKTYSMYPILCCLSVVLIMYKHMYLRTYHILQVSYFYQNFITNTLNMTIAYIFYILPST